MFLIHCPDCPSRHLMGSRSIRQLLNSDEGPIALVTCPLGHDLILRFRDGSARSAGAAAEESLHTGLGLLEPVGEQVGC
jgi:hypothetical protein